MFVQGARHRNRLAARRIDADDAYFRIKQQFMVAQDALVKCHLGAAQRGDRGFHRKQVVELRRLEKFDTGRAHREGDAFLHQGMLIMPEATQEFGAAAFDETKIVGVIDDAGGIGVFVVDAERKRNTRAELGSIEHMEFYRPSRSPTTRIQPGVSQHNSRLAGLGCACQDHYPVILAFFQASDFRCSDDCNSLPIAARFWPRAARSWASGYLAVAALMSSGDLSRMNLDPKYLSVNPAGPDTLARFGQPRLILEKDLGVAHGEYMLRRLIAMLDVDMVFDVGGNVGQYGLQLRNQIGYRGPLLSFEPIPQAASRIRLLTQSDAAWQVRECAIDNSQGRARFNVMVGDQFSSLMAPSKQFEGRFHGQHVIRSVIEVDVITLEDAVRDAPAFGRGLLKLDTQGNELRILRGGVDALPLFPAIQLEVGFQLLYEGESGFSQTVDQLDGWGYRLCALFPNNEGHFPHLLEMDAVFLRKEFFPDLP